MRPSLTWPKPWPPRSGGRWAAHSPRSLTCSLSGSMARSKPSWPSSSNTVSIGQISSRTKSRIQSSCCWNSGSVEKSHAIALPPPQVRCRTGWQESCATSARRRSSAVHEAARRRPRPARSCSPPPPRPPRSSGSPPSPFSFTADAYGNVVAWSSYDAAARAYRLRLLVGGAPVDAGRRRLARPVRPRRRPRPGRRAARRLLAARRPLPVRPGDGRRVAAGRGQHARHRAAPEHPLRPARLRPPRQRQARRSICAPAGTRSASRGRASRRRWPSRTSSSARAACSSSTAPTSSRRAARAPTLYRVDGKRLRHLFYVGSGGANFGQLVTPSVVGRSIYFARTNQGSGQGNRFFRYDLRTRRLFAARGTSRAQSVTWLGDRFLMSRTTGFDDDTHELVITDPITFRRASKADRRKTEALSVVGLRRRGGRPRDRGRCRRARGRGAAVGDRVRVRARVRAAAVRRRRARGGGLAADRARADRQPDDARDRGAAAAAARARLADHPRVGDPGRRGGRACCCRRSARRRSRSA